MRGRGKAASYLSQEGWLCESRREPLARKRTPSMEAHHPGQEPCEDKLKGQRPEAELWGHWVLTSGLKTHQLWGPHENLSPDRGDLTGAFWYVHAGGSDRTWAPDTLLNLNPSWQRC